MSGGMEECAKKAKKMNPKKAVVKKTKDIDSLDWDNFKDCESRAEITVVLINKINEVVKRVNEWEK